MPSNQIMPLFRAGKLHSGKSDGPIVKKKKQAVAIRLSYLRSEGKLKTVPLSSLAGGT